MRIYFIGSCYWVSSRGPALTVTGTSVFLQTKAVACEPGCLGVGAPGLGDGAQSLRRKTEQREGRKKDTEPAYCSHTYNKQHLRSSASRVRGPFQYFPLLH